MTIARTIRMLVSRSQPLAGNAVLEALPHCWQNMEAEPPISHSHAEHGNENCYNDSSGNQFLTKFNKAGAIASRASIKSTAPVAIAAFGIL